MVTVGVPPVVAVVMMPGCMVHVVTVLAGPAGVVSGCVCVGGGSLVVMSVVGSAMLIVSVSFFFVVGLCGWLVVMVGTVAPVVVSDVVVGRRMLVALASFSLAI